MTIGIKSGGTATGWDELFRWSKKTNKEKILIIITHSQDLLKYGTKILVIDNGLVKTKMVELEI